MQPLIPPNPLTPPPLSSLLLNYLFPHSTHSHLFSPSLLYLSYFILALSIGGGPSGALRPSFLSSLFGLLYSASLSYSTLARSPSPFFLSPLVSPVYYTRPSRLLSLLSHLSCLQQFLPTLPSFLPFSFILTLFIILVLLFSPYLSAGGPPGGPSGGPSAILPLLSLRFIILGLFIVLGCRAFFLSFLPFPTRLSCFRHLFLLSSLSSHSLSFLLLPIPLSVSRLRIILSAIVHQLPYSYSTSSHSHFLFPFPVLTSPLPSPTRPYFALPFRQLPFLSALPSHSHFLSYLSFSLSFPLSFTRLSFTLCFRQPAPFPHSLLILIPSSHLLLSLSFLVLPIPLVILSPTVHHLVYTGQSIIVHSPNPFLFCPPVSLSPYPFYAFNNCSSARETAPVHQPIDPCAR